MSKGPEKKKKILLVEDDDIFRDFLVKFLTNKGFEVTTALNGVEGLKEVSQRIFDLIITDLKMPEMSGLEFLKKLKEEIEKNDIHVIVLTGYGEIDSFIKAMDLGAFEFLNKPVDIDDLANAIKRAL